MGNGLAGREHCDCHGLSLQVVKQLVIKGLLLQVLVVAFQYFPWWNAAAVRNDLGAAAGGQYVDHMPLQC